MTAKTPYRRWLTASLPAVRACRSKELGRARSDCWDLVLDGDLSEDAALVTESASAHSYIFSKQLQKTCQFWLLTFWLLTVPSPSTQCQNVSSAP